MQGALHLDLTHNGHAADKEAMYLKTNQYHIAQFAYLTQRMKDISEGETSLLDNSILMLASSCVLLTACVNLANLMLVRMSARSRELVIRSALGASRWDLRQIMLAEGLILSLAGAALGAFAAWLGVEALRSLIPAEVPRVASFARVTSVNLGIDPHDALTARVRPLVGAANLGPLVGAQNWEQAQLRNRGMLRNILDQTRPIPGVDIALGGGGVPLRGDVRTVDFGIPGRVLPPDEDLDANEISADYFLVMRVPLLKGQFFSDSDRQGSEPVVILNDAAVRKYFPGEDPIGRTVRFNGTRRIVGVVGNIRHDGPETDWRRQGFVPLDQSRVVGATLVLRLSRDPNQVLPAVKSAIWSQFPSLALPDIQTLSQCLDSLIAERRFNMLLLGLFGVLGIVIACVGVYGVMAYVVTLRTQEIGIRMALGAVPTAILRSVLLRTALYLGSGLGVGLLGARVLSSLVSGFLFQIHPHDPLVYICVSAALVTTGAIGAYFPARRAARVDPIVALRLE